MTRRTGEETRELLLNVGLKMLFERGATAGVQHIRLQEVLRRSGMTTGAAYRLWADQTDYQRDLAVAMVRLRFSAPAGDAAGTVDPLLEEGRSLDDVIRAATEAHLEGCLPGGSASRDSRAFVIALALRTAAPSSPELREASRDRHEESIAGFSAFYQKVMRRYGLRVKAPYTLGDFAEAMAALGEGFAIRALMGLDVPALEVEGDRELPDGRWNLYALSVRGLISTFTEPDDVAAGTQKPREAELVASIPG